MGVLQPYLVSKNDDDCVNRCRWIAQTDGIAFYRCWLDAEHAGDLHKYFLNGMWNTFVAPATLLRGKIS